MFISSVFPSVILHNFNIIWIFDLELQGHTKPIHSVCWDPTGEFLASVSEDSVRVWTLGSGSEGMCVHELSCNGNKFYSCVFHPTYPSLLVIGCYQACFIFFTSGSCYKKICGIDMYALFHYCYSLSKLSIAPNVLLLDETTFRLSLSCTFPKTSFWTL